MRRGLENVGWECHGKSYEHEPYARIVSDLDSLVQPRMKQSDENNFLGIGLDRSLGRGVTEGPGAAV